MQINSTKQLKIAVVHDHLGWSGGGERTVLLMALNLGADFITAYAHPNTFPEYQEQLGDKLIILSKKVINTRVVRFFWLRGLFWRNRKLFKKYDVIIASAPTATEMVAKFARVKATKIAYTHTTPRRIYDKYEYSKKTYPLILQPLFAIFVRIWRWLYMRAILRYDYNIANSENTKKRVENHTLAEVNEVVWPPILTNKFLWQSQGDYYLSWARVDELKRVELIVKAFKLMPDKKLIVASGGPRLEAVRLLAKDLPNIEVLGWVEDKHLLDLVGNCRAAIYIPIDEDAGMTHLEANSAGKPILAVAEGGLTETTIDNQTGIIIKSNPDETDIIAGINQMTAEWCLSKKELCIKHAQKYSLSEFNKKIERIVASNNPALPIIGIDASRWEDPRQPGLKIKTGVEIYSMNLINSLIPLVQQEKIRIRIYTPRTIDELPLTIQKVIPGNKRWTQKHLNNELKHSPVNYFFTPSYYIPKHAPTNSFVTIHDVQFKHQDNKFSWIDRLKQDFVTRLNIKRAKKIFTVSEFSKTEIVKYYKLPTEKIIVAPIGYDRKDNLNQNLPRENKIVFIGRIEKKKSPELLIRAFADFLKIQPDWKLVLAGKPGFGFSEIQQLIIKLNLADKILLPGYISETEKYNLLLTARIFVHPGSAEGSSIPLFEAWDAQIPALISDTVVFKEIGKQGALYFKTGNQTDLTDKLNKLAIDIELQNSLIQFGVNNLKNMAWSKSAEQVLNEIIK